MKLTSSDHEKSNKIGSNRQRDDEQTSGSSQAQAVRVASLHRAVGNQAVQRMQDDDGERNGLTVSDPGDPAERKAERVAERVTDPNNQSLSGPVDGTALCDSVGPGLRAPGSLHLSRRRTGAIGPSNDVAVGTGIDRLRRSGRELPKDVKNQFESVFDADFEQVRIHTRGAADRAARSFDARAFTFGNHVVFRRGEYDPSRPDGRRLLAHELSHVVQSQTDPNVVYRQTAQSETTESQTANLKGQNNEYAKALVDWLGEQKDGKGTIPLSTSQEYEVANGTFSIDVDGELVVMPAFSTEFSGISIEWKPSSSGEDESKQKYSLDIGPQKTSLSWTYDPDLWTIEFGTVGSYGDDKVGEQSDVYTKVRADVDIAQLLVQKLSGGLLKRVEEKTNGAVEPMIDGIIGFEFRVGEGNDTIELHQNYADLKLGFKIDFWKLIQEIEKTAEAAGEAGSRGIQEGASDLHGIESKGREKRQSDGEETTEEPEGYTPEAGVGPTSVSSDFGLSFEAGAEFHAKTTYGETDEGAVKPTTAEVSTKGYVTVKIGYFTLDLTLWEGEGKSTGTPTERQAMRDRALASGLIDAMETVPLESLRGAAKYDEMASLVDAINEAWETAPDQYVRDAKSQITNPGSVIDWEWRNNYPMLFREVGGVDYFSVYSTVHDLLRIAGQQEPAVQRKAAVISRWPGRHGVEISERHRKALLDWQVAVNTAERLAMRTGGGISRSELLDDAVSLKNHVDMMLKKYTVATLKHVGKYEILANISRLTPEQIVRELTQATQRNTQTRRAREAELK